MSFKKVRDNKECSTSPKSKEWWLGLWEEAGSLACYMWALNFMEIKE